MEEPLVPEQAHRLILRILVSGWFACSRHAVMEMAKDELTTVDCVQVLRAGVVRPAEYEQGSWRYRVETRHATVVVAFRSRRELVVITAWRTVR
jgi:hypothetical protein